jgi:cytochrome P450
MEFLEAYKQLHTPAEQNALLLQWITQRRNDLFRQLRAAAPIFSAPDCVIVSRYAEVVEVLTDQDFTVEPYRQAGGGTFVLGMDDSPERDRALAILKLVVKRTDLDRIRTIAAETAKARIGDALSEGKLDLVSQFARLIPLRVADQYFGVPGPDSQSLGNWIAALSRAFIYYSTQHFIQDPLVEKEAEQARGDYAAYVSSLVAKTFSERLAGAPPRDDLLGRLITMQRAPTTAFATPEIVRNLMGLINGMIENISAALTNAMTVLLSLPPAQLKGAVAAAQSDNTALLLNYIEEALRLEAPVPFLARECLRDHVLAKGTKWRTPITKGQRVLAAICSAGQDGSVVHDPAAFRPGRTHYQPLHFGLGLHECLGKYMSQVQIVEMVKSLLVLEGIRRTRGAAGTPTYDDRSFFPKILLCQS